MTHNSGISVVIPCLNEQDSIAQVVDAAREGIAATGLPGEVIVVDNGSSDRSSVVAGEHGARVVAEAVKGYGAALRKGFSEARYSIIVMGDGDLTYDFTKLGDLTGPIVSGGFDFVVGNRMSNIRPGSMPGLHRYLGNPILSLLLRLMFWGHAVRDAHCGMRAITQSAYRRLRCVTTGMEFASEMIVSAIHCGLRMTERDIVYHPRVGDSKLKSFSDGWRHLRFMLLHSPTTALLAPGVSAWLVGTFIMLPLAFGPVHIGMRRIDIHCMLIGGLLNTISMQFITLGLLSKAYAHLSGLRHDPVIVWFYAHVTFERLMMFTIPMILTGLAVIGVVVTRWVESDFGPLDQARVLFLAIVCLMNGTQMAAAGYLFSIMALPRHVGRLSDEAGGSSLTQ
ncbi:MAG: glycosyltransferase family 2 protein [bacterium]